MKTRTGLILTVLTLLLATCAPLRAAERSKGERMRVLSDALAAFDEGAAEVSPARAAEHYREAAEGFETLIDDGVRNGAIYYNLGNTYLRLGDVGRAILNYRRAMELDPDDADLLANLRFARSRVETPIEPSGESRLLHGVFFWHFGTSVRGRMQVAVACFVGGWLLLTIRLFASGTWWRNVAIVLILIAAVSGASATLSRIDAQRHPEGVLVVDETIIRKGNGTTYERVFEEPLSAGVEFTILETRTDATGRAWHRVAFPNDAQGWLPADAAVQV